MLRGPQQPVGMLHDQAGHPQVAGDVAQPAGAATMLPGVAAARISGCMGLPALFLFRSFGGGAADRMKG
jgi:hypothetical protein